MGGQKQAGYLNFDGEPALRPSFGRKVPGRKILGGKFLRGKVLPSLTIVPDA